MVLCKMKILVTGDRGFIGSHLVTHLTGHEVKGMDLQDGRDILNCRMSFEPDVVIHLAAQSSVVQSVEDPMDTFKNNVMGTVRLLEWYKGSKFIFASSGGAIQDGVKLSPYGISKKCAEECVRNMSDDYVILRFANVYGPGGHCVVDKFIEADEQIIYGSGMAVRTYVHVNDIVRGIVQSLEWKKGLYWMGGNDDYTVDELAKATGKITRYVEARSGELMIGVVGNTTPDWKPEINVIEYIKQNI